VQGRWGDVLSQTLLLERGRNEGEALVAAERVESALAPHAGGEAGRVSGLSALLPSPAAQTVRAARWAAFWTGERVATLRTHLLEAGAEVGLRADSFEPFLASLVRPPEALTSASLKGTLFAPLVERHLAKDADGVRALVVLTGARDSDSAETPWRRTVAAAAPGTEVLSRKGLADAVVGAARHELESLALPALVAIGLLLLWYYRSPVRALVGLFPLAGALLATAAVLALAGEPLSMMNVPVALPIFGLGVDYAVFLMDSLEGTPPGVDGAEEVGRHGAPLLGAWLSTLAGGTALLVAEHPAARTLGAALVVGEGASLLFAWTAIPWLAGRRARSAP
jgi:predicted exporter